MLFVLGLSLHFYAILRYSFFSIHTTITPIRSTPLPPPRLKVNHKTRLAFSRLACQFFRMARSIQSSFRIEASELDELAAVRDKLGWSNGDVISLALDILGDGKAVQLLDQAHQASGIPRDQIAAQALESYCNKIIGTSSRGSADERIWQAWRDLIADGTPPTEYRLRTRARTGAKTIEGWMLRNQITPEKLKEASEQAQAARKTQEAAQKSQDPPEDDDPEENVAPPPPMRKGSIRL